MHNLYSSAYILKILTKHGFAISGGRGSHIKLKNKFGRVTIVPGKRKVIPVGTFFAILSQSGLNEEDFEKKKF